MALSNSKYKVFYGEPVVIEKTAHVWLKILSRTFLFSEATGDRPEGFVPQEAQISFDNQPEVTLRSGLELRPEGGFNQVTVFNPNDGLPLEIELLMGTGDVRDSSVTFNIDPSQALAVNVAQFATDVSLPATIEGSVRLDNEYHLYNPLGVVFRGGAGTAPTSPLHVTFDGSGVGSATFDGLITNPASNPVQTTLAGVSDATPLCVSICDVGLTFDALRVSDSGVFSQAQTHNTLLTATNGKLDTTNALLGGLDTDLGAIRLDTANTANALTTTNSHLVDVVAGLGGMISTRATKTALGGLVLGGRFSDLGSSSFNTDAVAFQPQLLSFGQNLEAWRTSASGRAYGGSTIAELSNQNAYDFSFHAQAKIFRENPNRKSLKITAIGGNLLLSTAPFALGRTSFSNFDEYLAELQCYWTNWISQTNTAQPELGVQNALDGTLYRPLARVRNIVNNVYTNIGVFNLISGSNGQCQTISAGGVLEGSSLITQVPAARSSFENGFASDAWQAIPNESKRGSGPYRQAGNFVLVRQGETYETDGINELYALSADNSINFTRSGTGADALHDATNNGVALQFEETYYEDA